MSRSREELRQGIRALIQDTSRRLHDLEAKTPPETGTQERFLPRPEELQQTPSVPSAPPSDPGTQRPGLELDELQSYDERRGVCFAFFVNRKCWEVQEAYCNHALHICMLRQCPVYELHREELERRFADKFKYLW